MVSLRAGLFNKFQILSSSVSPEAFLKPACSLIILQLILL